MSNGTFNVQIRGVVGSQQELLLSAALRALLIQESDSMCMTGMSRCTFPILAHSIAKAVLWIKQPASIRGSL